MDPNCVSINVGPLEGGKHNCELNDATSEQQEVTHILKNMEGYTHLAMEVTLTFVVTLSVSYHEMQMQKFFFFLACTVDTLSLNFSILMEQQLHVMPFFYTQTAF